MSHEDYMRRALRLAARGRPSPNPMVGAVVVKDGKVVGEGYHRRAGEPHAEAVALQKASSSARGAVLYVTLEPCCHHGRTPPCTRSIIDAGVTEVYAAMLDPDPKVAGKGFDELVRAGVRVHYPLLESEARRLNEAYIKHRTTGLPLVTLKSAMSLDGCIATASGDSKWITSERSRLFAHRIRAKVDAIVIGAGTARLDNPQLTARVGERVYYPRRVVVTKSGNLPSDLKIFNEPGECIIACPGGFDDAVISELGRSAVQVMVLPIVCGRVSMHALMKRLGDMGCLSVLIEGGAETAAAALEERVVDRVMFFYSPKIIGGLRATHAVGGVGVGSVDAAIKIRDARMRRLGEDFLVEGCVEYPEN
ncbi:MAG: bifunctional diaminohydroxyphosphoribosylaminopyrimidine deaminase/5-amino-6-(5-phosphoribosylamino)uracil reductase RibD [Armatimonadota bacterium]